MEKNIDIVLKNNRCTGCQACVYSCPKNAISYDQNSFGFFTAKIDNEKCVKCGICLKLCPSINELSIGKPIGSKYGWSLNNEVRLSSTSGGLFVELSNKFLISEKDIVVGCVLDCDNTIKHKIGTKKDLSSFQGSKYVQSNLSDIYLKIKTNLDQGSRVIFTGTPCQVYGLLAFIPEELKANLLTIDFVCHGVPSQKLFLDHCNFNKYVFLSFRSKDRKGWERSELKVIKNGKTKYIKQWRDKYIYMFNNKDSNNLNPACCDCVFINNHKSDITLADFWQFQKENIDIKDIKDGVSLIVLNTEKGMDLVNSLENKCHLKDVSNTDVLKERKNKYSKSSSESFYEYYSLNGYRKAMKKYAKNSYFRALFKKLFKK